MEDKEIILLTLIVVLVLLVIFSFAKYIYKRDINIHQFTIYKGTPSEINGVTTIDGAIKQYSKYDSVILGGGYELDVSADHQNTKEIIRKSNTKFYGSIDVSTKGMNYSLKEINERIHKWFLMGAVGIYLENFDDSDYVKNTEILKYIDMLSGYFKAIIPVLADTNMKNYNIRKCILLAKNLVVDNGTILNAHNVFNRVRKLQEYKPYQIWSHNTLDKNNIIYEMHLNYSYHLSSILGCSYFCFIESTQGSNYLDYKIPPKHSYQYQLWTTPIMYDRNTIKRKTTGYVIEIDVDKSNVKIKPLFSYWYIPADYIR